MLLIQVIGYRIYSNYRIRSDKQAREVWYPVFAELMFGFPESFPQLKKSHQHECLLEWNRFHATLRGEVRIRLCELAKSINLEKIAYRYLHSKHIGNQLLAIVTLGHIKDDGVWNSLIDYINDENPLLSLTAAQALVDINSNEAIPYLVPHIIKRKDWPVSRVARLLDCFNIQKFTKELGDILSNAKPDDILHILRFLGTSHFDPNIKRLYDILGNSKDSRIIAACISAAKDYDGLVLARENVNNEKWFVRLQVAKALGLLGTKDDIHLLIQLMSDEEWWVRYRSAQALTQLPCIDMHDLMNLKNTLDDRYAKDILQQVISEKRLC